MNIRQLPSRLNRALLSALLFVTTGFTALRAQRISVADPGATPVVVESAAIATEITGRIAVTTFDLVFRNPNDRVLEGNFEFPLLEGQTVVSFALDLNGRLRDAVPVEKNHGRIVFEEIERRGVDPALLEQTSGNNYRARIYPIPSRGTRRVVITYQEDIALSADNPAYKLALNFPTPLETFRLLVNVQTETATAAKIKTTLPMTLPEWRDAKYLEIKRKRFNAQGVFELELPTGDHAHILTERRDDKEYFYTEIPMPEIKPVMRPVPSIVGLLWDASGSGRERDHERELALLDAWFKVMGEVEVRLIAFREQTSTPVRFKIEHGEWSKLRAELEKIVYDGATSFDGLTDDPAIGEWLMFSDGLVNYGVTQATGKFPLGAPVHTVLASPRANPALLRGLARRQKGEFVNLFSATPQAAATLLRHESLRVLKIEHNPEQLAQIFPETGTSVDDGTLIVTGILKKTAATIRLQLGHNASDAREMELSLRSRTNPSHLAARAWATTKIASLECDQTTNREDIRRTSQEFGIVTADTSLIVLESLQDYLQYDITPPEELRAEWEKNRRTSSEFIQKGRNDKLAQISRLFSEKVKWWETKFSRTATPKPIPVSAVASNQSDFSSSPDVAPRPSSSSIRSLEESDELLVLSPFVVTADSDAGYRASSTLAGTRIRTESRDIRGSTHRTNAPAHHTESGDEENQDSTSNGSSQPASITLRRWEPTAGYLDRLRRAAPDERYSIYLEERSEHISQPGFYLDVAEFFFGKENPATALRIVSNLAELQLDDPALLRVLAHRLVQAAHPELALPLFERVLTLRPEEPQSLRDLALVCSVLKQHQRAIDLLWQIVVQPWNGRFPEIELIALGELNAIVATCGEKLDLSQIDARLQKNLPVGLRVILTWDADACDIDLWVGDPSGELAIYNHPRTVQGGQMSRDFTGGYGPEEFLLRNPEPGKYTVRINYFGDRRQTALGPVTAQARVITGFGTPSEKEQRLTLRLTGTDKNLAVGEIEIGK